MNNVLGVLFPLAAIALAAGCGAEDSDKYSVSGMVTLDGKPLPEGDIVFRATDGQVAGSAGKIINGEYSFDSFPGPKTVSITATRIVEGLTQADVGNPGDEGPVYEQYLPARYNFQSTLEAEVVSDGANTFDFDLTSERDAADSPRRRPDP